MKRRIVFSAAFFATTAMSASVAARAQSPTIIVRRDSVIMRGAKIPLDSIKMIVGLLQQEDFGSPSWFVLTQRLDSLMNIAFAHAGAGVGVRGILAARAPMAPVRGWIGFDVQGPYKPVMDETGQHIIYLAHPSIISVEPESPAGRAGIAPGDVLLAYNGIDVVGHDFNVSELLVPDRKLDVRVRRDGEPHDYTLTVARPPQRVTFRAFAMPAKPRIDGDGPGEVLMVPRSTRMMHPPMLPGNIFIIGRDGVLGATMSTVGPDLAQALNLGGTGVLVNQVIDNSPAAQSGLRVGDIVVNVDSKPISTLEDLRAIVQANMERHAIALRIVRERKTREITLKW